MRNAILTINAGSSSVKFALFEASDSLPLLIKGQIDGIGSDARIRVKQGDGNTLKDDDLSEVSFA